MNAAEQLIRRSEELAQDAPIGPRWEYVNPQGVLFHARSGDVIAILQLAARS